MEKLDIIPISLSERISITLTAEVSGVCSEFHYIAVIITTVASQITSLTVVYSIVYSDAEQRKRHRAASLAIVRGIHRVRWIPRTKGR